MMDGGGFDVRRNLIVNYLPPTFSQHDVEQIFSQIENVLKCKLMRSQKTGESLGYAFIEYPDEDSTSRAIAELDGLRLADKTIKVSYARQSTPDIKNANVYVAGLPDYVTEEKLYSLFTPFGSILSQKILTNPNGSSRGAGFVRYSLNSEATYAIQQMNGKLLHSSDTPLTVKLAIPPAEKKSITMGDPAIYGLTQLSNQPSVRYNPMAKPIPYGYPTAESSVAAAISQQQQQQQGGGFPCPSIYVYGLLESHTELTLYELFAPFGGIANVKLIRNLKKEGNPCKGYGFVNYTLGDEALNAVAKMNGVHYQDRVLQVSLKTRTPFIANR